MCILALALFQSLGSSPFTNASSANMMDKDTLRSFGMSSSEIESLLAQQDDDIEKARRESILGYENDDSDEYDEYEYDSDSENEVLPVFQDEDMQLELDDDFVEEVDDNDENDQILGNPSEDEYDDEFYDDDDSESERDKAEVEVEQADAVLQDEPLVEESPLDVAIDDFEDEYEEYDEYDDDDVGLDAMDDDVKEQESINTKDDGNSALILKEAPHRSQTTATRPAKTAASAALPVLLPKIGQSLIQSPLPVQVFALGTLGNIAFHRMRLAKKLKPPKVARKRKGKRSNSDKKSRNISEKDIGDHDLKSYFEESEYFDLDELDDDSSNKKSNNEDSNSFEEIEDMASSLFDDDKQSDADKKPRGKRSTEKIRKESQKEARERKRLEREQKKAEIEERRKQERQLREEEMERTKKKKQRQRKKANKSEKKDSKKIDNYDYGDESGDAFVEEESKSQRKGIFGGRESEIRILTQKIEALTQRADEAEASRDQLEADCFSASTKVCPHYMV